MKRAVDDEVPAKEEKGSTDIAEGGTLERELKKPRQSHKAAGKEPGTSQDVEAYTTSQESGGNSTAPEKDGAAEALEESQTNAKKSATTVEKDTGAGAPRETKPERSVTSPEADTDEGTQSEIAKESQANAEKSMDATEGDGGEGTQSEPAADSQAKAEKSATAKEEDKNEGTPTESAESKDSLQESKLKASGIEIPKTTMEFPAQLMDLLQRDVAPDAMWFLPEGEALAFDRNLFTKKVLDVYFRGMKFNSFVRNMNRWGFRRITHPSLKDTDRGYHHLLFKRDSPELVKKMSKDSNANEVVRHFDMANDSSNTKKSKRKGKMTQSSEKTSDINVDSMHQNHLHGYNPGLATRDGQHIASMPPFYAMQQQQLLWQNLMQQQLAWQQNAASQYGFMPGTGGMHYFNGNPANMLPAGAEYGQGFLPSGAMGANQYENGFCHQNNFENGTELAGEVAETNHHGDGGNSSLEDETQ